MEWERGLAPLSTWLRQLVVEGNKEDWRDSLPIGRQAAYLILTKNFGRSRFKLVDIINMGSLEATLQLPVFNLSGSSMPSRFTQV